MIGSKAVQKCFTIRMHFFNGAGNFLTNFINRADNK